MSVGGTDNVNGNNDDINVIFTIKDAKLYIPVVILIARYNQNYQNSLGKDLKDQFIGMNIKQNLIIKLQQTNFS